LIPTYLLAKHMPLIFCLELLSIYGKYIVFKLKCFFIRPRIVMVDEGILNTMFNYLAFFGGRNTSLWKPLVWHMLRLWKAESRNHAIMLVIVMPEISELINRWKIRGDLQSLSIAERHLRSYVSIWEMLVRIVEVYISSAKIHVFADNVEALKGLLKLIKGIGSHHERESYYYSCKL